MSTPNPKSAAPTAQPTWRQGYDAVEAMVGPPLEQLVRSDQFAQGVAIVTRFRRQLETQAARTSRHVLHRLNLPAGSDVTRLLNEIGELRKQVRQLTAELAARESQTTTTAAKRGGRGRAAG